MSNTADFCLQIDFSNCRMMFYIKIRYSLKKKLRIGLGIIVIFVLLHPSMNGRRSYEYIDKEVILDNLHEELTVNFSSTAIADCEYYDALFDETTLSLSLVDEDLVEGNRIREGGEFSPADCKPKYSTAVIVPYRDRAEQLRSFLVYMHTFLRRQRIHYRIYVIEQIDARPFNRAKLMNVGAAVAMKAGYPCLVLHDVDLLPLRPANLYACTRCPRHMSSSINKFRFVLPYLELFGGAIAILSKQYKAINGMSNEYFGRGGEDDDLYSRMKAHDLKMCRFEMETSRYHMVTHTSQLTGRTRQNLLKIAKERMEADGLNSLHYSEVATVLHPLFTHVMVEL